MGGNVGLAISSALTLTGTFQWGMRQSAETENLMTSVERALEYVKIESEAALESAPGMPLPYWYKHGY
jgi:ATP-binding cassette subfamily C (CFTR/MRP) protein 4